MSGVVDKVGLIGTGMIQVMLVSAQTYFIARGRIAFIVIVGFLISLVWTINVKRVAFGGWVDRVLYATGAAIGALIGVFLAIWLNQAI